MGEIKEVRQVTTGDGKKTALDVMKLQMTEFNTSERERFRNCLRSVVEKNRQEGEYRSTAPDLRNMTEGQILLEVLSRSDWSKRLQKEGIEVNKPTFRLMHHMLLDRMNASKPSDFNPAVRNFNDALDKFKDKEFAELHIKPIGFQGGIFFRYDRDSQEYQGRFITLKDPEGKTRTFNQGEGADRIAEITSHVIKVYKGRYAPEQEYTKGKALTGDEVVQLKEGERIHGWTCITFKYVTLPVKVYYTNMGTPLDAVDLSAYEPWSRQMHDAAFPYPEFTTLADPTPVYNCAADLFINSEAWLIYTKMRQGESQETLIRTILREHKYYGVNEKEAKFGDLVFYCRPHDINIDEIDVTDLIPHYLDNIVIKHVGKVIDTNPIQVRSKSGEAAPGYHDLRASLIVNTYGIPIICRTDRPEGHKLLTAEEWQAKQPT